MRPNPLGHLGPDQCLELLASCQVGRVGASIGALPVMLPLNYVVFDDGVLFRTAAGTKLDAAARGIVVAFEADTYDRDGRTGWSVLLVGKANEVSDLLTLERAEAVAMSPWPGAEGQLHYVHIKAERIWGPSVRPVANDDLDPRACSV